MERTNFAEGGKDKNLADKLGNSEILKVLSEVSGGGGSGSVQGFYLINGKGETKLEELQGNKGENVFKKGSGDRQLKSALGVCIGEGEEGNCVRGEGYELHLVSDEGWVKKLNKDNLKTNFSGFLIGKTTEDENGAKTANEKVDLSKIGDKDNNGYFESLNASAVVSRIEGKNGKIKDVLEKIKNGFGKEEGTHGGCGEKGNDNFWAWIIHVSREPGGHACPVSLYDVLKENQEKLKDDFGETSEGNNLKLLLSLMYLWSHAQSNVAKSALESGINDLNKVKKALKIGDNKISSNFVEWKSIDDNESPDKINELKVWGDVEVKSISLRNENNNRGVKMTFNGENVDVKIGELKVKFSMEELKNLDHNSFEGYLEKTILSGSMLGIFSNRDSNKNLFNLIYLFALLASDRDNKNVDVSFGVDLDSKTPMATIKGSNERS